MYRLRQAKVWHGCHKEQGKAIQLACFKADVYRLFFELMIMTVVVELLESVTCIVLWMGRHERDLRQMTLYWNRNGESFSFLLYFST